MGAIKFLPTVGNCCFVLSIPVATILICFVCIACDDFFVYHRAYLYDAMTCSGYNYRKHGGNEGSSRAGYAVYTQLLAEQIRQMLGLIAGLFLMLAVVESSKLFVQIWIILQMIAYIMHILLTFINAVNSIQYITLLSVNTVFICYAIVVVNGFVE